MINYLLKNYQENLSRSTFQDMERFLRNIP